MSGPFKAPCLGSPQRMQSLFPFPVWETRAPNQYAQGLGPGDLGSDLDVLEAIQGLEPDEEAPLPIAEARTPCSSNRFAKPPRAVAPGSEARLGWRY